MFAKRTGWELTPNKIAVVLEEVRQSQKSILDLTESNPTQCGFSYPQDKIFREFKNPSNLSYIPSAKGALEARKAICSYYKKKNIEVDPQRIFLTASTSEAYSFLFRLLANLGEKVLFPRPSYPLFQYLSDINDLVFDSYPLTYHEGWGIDFKELHRAISHDTKALVLVNPNNPTGSFIKQREIDQINAISRKSEIPIICDEVFLDYKFDENIPAVSLAQENENLSFTLGGLSKSLGLPQMKLSWIIISGRNLTVDAAMNRLEIIADTYLSVNTPAQNALKGWFDLQPVLQKEIIERIRRNRTFLGEKLSVACPAKGGGQTGQILQSEGGWYAVIRLPQWCNEEQLTLRLLKEDSVLVQPGYFYDFYDEPYIVLSLLPAEDIFREGVSRIIERVKKMGTAPSFSDNICKK